MPLPQASELVPGFVPETELERAVAEDPHLRAGLNVYKNTLTYGAVAEAQNLPFKSAEEVLKIAA